MTPDFRNRLQARAMLAGCALVLLLPRSAPAQTLNLSRDLVPLKIAATNMVPDQPALDAGPLFLQGVAYAKGHGITLVIADPGTYYFLGLAGQNVHVQIADISDITIDLQGSELIFLACRWPRSPSRTTSSTRPARRPIGGGSISARFRR